MDSRTMMTPLALCGGLRVPFRPLDRVLVDLHGEVVQFPLRQGVDTALAEEVLDRLANRVRVAAVAPGRRVGALRFLSAKLANDRVSHRGQLLRCCFFGEADEVMASGEPRWRG